MCVFFLDYDSQTALVDKRCFGIVSGHGSQVLAPPDHVEEIDGKDEGQRANHAHSSEILTSHGQCFGPVTSKLPWTRSLEVPL